MFQAAMLFAAPLAVQGMAARTDSTADSLATHVDTTLTLADALARASTILDRLTSEATLVGAEQDAVIARYDYGIARAQLEALAGRSL